MTDPNTLKIIEAIGEVRLEVQESRTEIEKLRGEVREGMAQRPVRDEITTTIKTTIQEYCAAHHHGRQNGPTKPVSAKVIVALVGAIGALTAAITALAAAA